MASDGQSISDSSKTQVISLEEIEQTWEISASNWLQSEFRKLDFTFHSLTSVDRDESLIQTVSALLSELPKAGVHRQNDWESGWGQNLEDLERNSDETSIIPKYFKLLFCLFQIFIMNIKASRW